MSQAGSLTSSSGGGGAPGVNQLGLIVGPTVDVTVNAVTTFTTLGSTDFVVVGMVLRNVTLTGVPGAFSLGVGWTPTAYGDLLNHAGFQWNVQGDSLVINSFLVFDTIPANSVLKINVTNPDATATADTVNFTLIGYYI